MRMLTAVEQKLGGRVESGETAFHKCSKALKMIILNFWLYTPHWLTVPSRRLGTNKKHGCCTVIA